MTPASLLAVLISLSPPAIVALEPPSTTAEAPKPRLEDDSAAYTQALANVNAAMSAANEDPAVGAAQLRDALNTLRQHAARLATDLDGQELRTSAQLTLARALLAANLADGARDAMDEAIRTSRGDPLPTKNFGPGLVALHRERDGVLAKQGTGRIVVTCHVACRVLVNERPASEQVDRLIPGTYRVLIEDLGGNEAALSQLVEIAGDGDEVALEFGRKLPDTPPPSTPDATAKPRLLPRWADILLMTAGAAAIGTGAALWAIDGSCPKGASPSDPEACPQVYITKTAGIVTLAAGSAVFLSGTIVLSIDEVRTARQKDQPSTVSLGWRMRF